MRRGLIGVFSIVGATALNGAAWGHRDSPADLNGDGIVGAADLLILLVNWGDYQP